MDIFSRFIKKKNVSEPLENATTLSLECKELKELNERIIKLLDQSHYVAKSEYLSWIPEYKNTVSFFDVLKKSGMLSSFCNQNGILEEDVLNSILNYNNIEQLVDDANNMFIDNQLIADKTYLDGLLREVDPNIALDEDQRRVILSDEDYCLVIAGAGAGKTTTVAAKVKYLVDKKGINPRDILIISFTNKAAYTKFVVKPLKERKSTVRALDLR